MKKVVKLSKKIVTIVSHNNEQKVKLFLRAIAGKLQFYTQ